ncbi:MAG: hypothetical protein AAF560_31930, partial [Acidobacteriota bacterium]
GGSQWVAAPTFLKILCFAPLVDPFTRLGGEVLKVKHRDGYWILCTLVTMLTFLVGGIILTSIMGPIGMAWINLVPLGGLLMARALYQIDPEGLRELVRKLLYVYLIPIPLFTAVALATDEATPLRFALSLIAIALSLGLVFRKYGKDFVAFFRGESADV